MSEISEVSVDEVTMSVIDDDMPELEEVEVGNVRNRKRNVADVKQKQRKRKRSVCWKYEFKRVLQCINSLSGLPLDIKLCFDLYCSYFVTLSKGGSKESFLCKFPGVYIDYSLKVFRSRRVTYKYALGEKLLTTKCDTKTLAQHAVEWHREGLGDKFVTSDESIEVKVLRNQLRESNEKVAMMDHIMKERFTMANALYNEMYGYEKNNNRGHDFKHCLRVACCGLDPLIRDTLMSSLK